MLGTSAVNKALVPKKVVETASLDDLFAGKLTKDTPEKAPKISKGKILSFDNKDNTYGVTFEGCVDAEGKPSVWEADSKAKSIMLAYKSETVSVKRGSKTVECVMTVSLRAK